jgi:hypothetical protein
MTKNYLMLFLFLIISVSTRAQRPKPAAVSLPPVDTVYFDRDWERTETLEEVSYARIAHRDASGKPMGTVRDYFYPSWKKQWEGKLYAEKPDKPTGLCCGWHENGQVSFRGTYLNGAQQADFRSWREDGREIKCRSLMQDALPLSTATLHCSNCMHSSRNVFTVDIPAGTAGIVYKLDVRDEGQPPISWSTAMAVAAVAGSGGTAAPALLGTAASALLKQGNTGISRMTQLRSSSFWLLRAPLPIPACGQPPTRRRKPDPLPLCLAHASCLYVSIMTTIPPTRRLHSA